MTHIETLKQEPCVFSEKPSGCYRIRCQLGGKCVDDGMSFRASPPPRHPWVGLTDEMVTAAARALNDRQAKDCGVNKDDHWYLYGDDIKEDARVVLEAAHGIKGEA